MFVLAVLGYYMATMAYSLALKRQPILDIVMLAGLYTARIVAGGVAAGIPISVWLLAFSGFFFFSLAAVKRQAELVDVVASGREKAHGRGYTGADLPLVTAMATASGYVSILVLGLYINSPAVLELYANPPMLWGVCLVMFYWVNRLVMLTHRGQMHDDPVVFAVTDRTSQICFATVIAIIALGAVGGIG
jgi:4-hydroxybenzoate polyprenyltransferase